MNLESLSIDQVLKRYDLPHRFLVRFAVHCAEKALALVKDPEPRSVKAVALAKRFGEGEDIAQGGLERAAREAAPAYYAASSAASSAATYAASSATYAATYAASCAYAYAASSAATYATYAASYASSPKNHRAFEEELRQELLRMIKVEFSEVELILRSNE